MLSLAPQPDTTLPIQDQGDIKRDFFPTFSFIPPVQPPPTCEPSEYGVALARWYVRVGFLQKAARAGCSLGLAAMRWVRFKHMRRRRRLQLAAAADDDRVRLIGSHMDCLHVYSTCGVFDRRSKDDSIQWRAPERK